ncbi:hypothetical protein DBV15_01037 [Temnothorax longispinosus]|uniref:Uncharacterized protein n=1 Tax=Temnothorax longispinosus TaxID=300112 RepID=A0A4S2JCH6_9HYME|nr:hypothetical protein DBV15_01037 [Temnothorax longispinosus]
MMTDAIAPTRVTVRRANRRPFRACIASRGRRKRSGVSRIARVKGNRGLGVRTVTRVDRGVAAYYPTGTWHANKMHTRRGNLVRRPGEQILMRAVTDAGIENKDTGVPRFCPAHTCQRIYKRRDTRFGTTQTPINAAPSDPPVLHVRVYGIKKLMPIPPAHLCIPFVLVQVGDRRKRFERSRTRMSDTLYPSSISKRTLSISRFVASTRVASGAKPKRGACYTGLRQRSSVVQLADTIRAAREKDFITLVRDRAPYADFMQDRAALSAPAERSPSRKFRRNLDGVIEHVPFGPRTYIFPLLSLLMLDRASLADAIGRGKRIFRRDTHRCSHGEITRRARSAPHILFNHVTALQSARSNLLREVEGRPRYEERSNKERLKLRSESNPLPILDDGYCLAILAKSKSIIDAIWISGLPYASDVQMNLVILVSDNDHDAGGNLNRTIGDDLDFAKKGHASLKGRRLLTCPNRMYFITQE